ncbi:MAG TPA: hypothetical protein VGP72_18800 [Planctomycetota bacterium]
METSRRIGYVLNHFRPRDAGLMKEIAAHAAAGSTVEIFCLHSPRTIRAVRKVLPFSLRVTVLPDLVKDEEDAWMSLRAASRVLPGFWNTLAAASGQPAEQVIPAVCVAEIARQRGLTHLHASSGGAPVAVARLAAQLAQISYSFRVWRRDIACGNAQSAQFEGTLVEARAVFVASDYCAAWLRRNHALAAERIQHVRRDGMAAWERFFESLRAESDLPGRLPQTC